MANLGLVEEGAVVGEDPVALLERWLRRTLAFYLVALLLLLVASPAARVGIRGAPHGIRSDSTRVSADRRGLADWERTTESDGQRRREGEWETRTAPMVIIPGQAKGLSVFLCSDPRGLSRPKCNCLQYRGDQINGCGL